MRVAAYVRVSTADQNCQLQIRELREFAAHQGWEIGETYDDIMSGTRSSRPELNRLMEDVRARKLDCILVWKLDRFGRSLVDCLNNIQTLEEHSTRFIAVTQGLDTDLQNPASRFLLHVLGAAAEFERALIRSGPRPGGCDTNRTSRAEKWERPSLVGPVGTCRPTGQGKSSIEMRLSNSSGKGYP